MTFLAVSCRRAGRPSNGSSCSLPRRYWARGDQAQMSVINAATGLQLELWFAEEVQSFDDCVRWRGRSARWRTESRFGELLLIESASITFDATRWHERFRHSPLKRKRHSKQNVTCNRSHYIRASKQTWEKIPVEAKQFSRRARTQCVSAGNFLHFRVKGLAFNAGAGLLLDLDNAERERKLEHDLRHATCTTMELHVQQRL